MNKTQELFKVMSENPELEVIVLVSEDCTSEYGYTVTDISSIKVCEVATHNDRFLEGFRIYEKSDIADLIENIAEYDFDGTDEDYEKAKEIANNKPWKKVIRVYVDGYEGDVI